jgi:hypothetical protein
MQSLKNKLNLTASTAMTYMVIKKKKGKENLLGNGTQVDRTVSKYATARAVADDVRMRHFTRI